MGFFIRTVVADFCTISHSFDGQEKINQSLLEAYNMLVNQITELRKN